MNVSEIFLTGFVTLFCLMTIVWMIQLFTKNAGVADVFRYFDCLASEDQGKLFHTFTLLCKLNKNKPLVKLTIILHSLYA